LNYIETVTKLFNKIKYFYQNTEILSFADIDMPIFSICKVPLGSFLAWLAFLADTPEEQIVRATCSIHEWY